MSIKIMIEEVCREGRRLNLSVSGDGNDMTIFSSHSPEQAVFASCLPFSRNEVWHAAAIAHRLAQEEHLLVIAENGQFRFLDDHRDDYQDLAEFYGCKIWVVENLKIIAEEDPASDVHADAWIVSCEFQSGALIVTVDGHQFAKIHDDNTIEPIAIRKWTPNQWNAGIFQVTGVLNGRRAH